MINLNRLSALILGINRQEYRLRESKSGFLSVGEFKGFLRQDNSKSGKIFDIFRELQLILDQLTLGAITGILTFLGLPQPRLPAQPGNGILYFDSSDNRFRASEDTRKYFDAFPREGCRVYNTANISIPDVTVTALTFNTKRFDPFNIFTISTSQIVINRTGRYVFGGCVEFAADINGSRQLSIRLNGTTFIAVVNRTALGGIADRVAVETTYEFVAGDFLELTVYQDSGAALNVVAVGNYSPEFYCARVHDQPV